MTEKVKKAVDGKEKSERFFLIKLLITVALAFCAALVFRRSSGVISMTPLAFLLIFACAFIGISRYVKTAVFVIMVFSLNTVELADMKIAFIYTALCLLACVLFEYAAAKIKGKKKLGYAVAAFGLAVCISLSFLLIGNPFKAYKAQQMFDEYIERVYPESDNAVLGKFDFSKVYYNYRTKTFASDGVSSLYPTEIASLTTKGKVINDGFAPIMQSKIAVPYVSEMILILQENFPNDAFSVVYDGIATLPGETPFSAAEGELYNSMNYIITIVGIQGAKEMLERTEEYLNAINSSELGYGRIIFRSGIGNWYRCSITVEDECLIAKPSFRLERVKLGTSSNFNKFVSKTLSLN